MFSYRIAHLTEHLKKNRKDFHTQRALIKLVGKRRKLLDYFEVDRNRVVTAISLPSSACVANYEIIETRKAIGNSSIAFLRFCAHVLTRGSECSLMHSQER